MLRGNGRFRRTRVILIAAVGVGLCAMGLWVYQPRSVVRWIASRNKSVLFSVETSEKVIALSIDDGPHESVTGSILDVLDRHGARATFFVLGDNVRRLDGMCRQICERGHEIGNHMMRDRPSIVLSEREFERELDTSIGLLSQYPCAKNLFRPGSGWFDRRMIGALGRRGYRCCLGSLYPHDPKVRSVSMISSFILGKVAPGDILILHDGRDDRRRTVRVLERVLPVLADRGFRVVTVSQLLSVDERASTKPRFESRESDPRTTLREAGRGE